MKILVINCHPDNRGDEAAVHAMVDEISAAYPGVEITLAIRGAGTKYPNMPLNVKMIHQFMPISSKAKLAHRIAVLTGGRVSISSNEKSLISEISKADIILHAPGGPSIGDTYYSDEPTYLAIYDLLIVMHKPYMFYAPSMGPFQREERNSWRKKVLEHSEAIVLRDPISEKYVRDFVPDKTISLTLDSAFQHDVNIEQNKEKLNQYMDLKRFLEKHEKCVGVTITDLLWHPVYSKNPAISKKIHDVFHEFLSSLTKAGYGVVFIPQLYGNGNDYDLMRTFCCDTNDYFVVTASDERYDTYFQQYLIGQLYAVIGMRYHSNIFSAKMGTPFISISYEQKMKGFMEKMNLAEYCIDLKTLSKDTIENRFEQLVNHYDEYKKYLCNKHTFMKSEAHKTTDILATVLERKEKAQ